MCLVLCHRGCTWDEAERLLELARPEKSLARPDDQRPKPGSKRAAGNRSGYYITRNAYQGKRFVALMLEKATTTSYNVVIVRPTTGRNEMNAVVS